MTYDTIAEYIRTHKGGTRSTEDQEQLAKMMYDDGLVPSAEPVKKDQLEEMYDDKLTHNLSTPLENLEDIDLVHERKAGSGWIDDVADDFINHDEAYDVKWPEYREALISHIQEMDPSSSEGSTAAADGGETLRSIVAKRIEPDIHPSELEEALREEFDDDDDENQIFRMNTAIEAVGDSGDYTVREDEYGKLHYTNCAHRFRLTEKAVKLIEKERGAS